MTTETIEESRMEFGPYLDGYCFHIEKSKCYTSIQNGLKMAEFLLLKGNAENPVVWIVEAKSSAPHCNNEADFDKFIGEIREKFVNAFSLGWACILKRHQQAGTELPEKFQNLDLSKTEVKFVLVINGHDESWLPPLQGALSKALKTTRKTWALNPNSVAVINDAMAEKNELILPVKRDES